MKKISIYLNPLASQRKLFFQKDELIKYLPNYEVSLRTSSKLTEFENMIREDCQNGVDYFFAWGGDGTVHTIIQNIIGSSGKLLVFPGGTANDFSCEVGTNKTLPQIINVFHSQRTQKVDLIKVKDRYIVTNGGIGIATDVARQLSSVRGKYLNFLIKLLGRNIYLLFFLKELLFRPLKCRKIYIDSPDFPLLKKIIHTPLILINNQPMLGGRFLVAPKTLNNDGKFNVTIFMHEKKMSFLKTSLQIIFRKVPINNRDFIQFETDHLNLISADGKDLEFFGDGEIFEPSKELTFSIVPQFLEVFSDHYFKRNTLKSNLKSEKK